MGYQQYLDLEIMSKTYYLDVHHLHHTKRDNKEYSNELVQNWQDYAYSKVTQAIQVSTFP